MEPNLSQALHLLNGDTTTELIRQGGRVRALLDAGRAPADVARELWLRCYARPPAEAELAAVLATIPEGPREATEPALEDLFWALLNSKEFVFDH